MKARFINNRNGTITDTLTGLMWQQKTAGPMTHQEALDYCIKLSLGGYSGWRLPNIKELQSLVDYTRYNPAIDTSAFLRIISFTYYWSSTTDANNMYYAWYISFFSGCIGAVSKLYGHYVLAVRGECEYLAI